MTHSTIRVRVVQDSRVTHESTFTSEALAQAYFTALNIPGAMKYVQRRVRGSKLYVTGESVYMSRAEDARQ